MQFNPDVLISGIDVYSGGNVIVKRRGLSNPPTRGDRKEITELSASSRAKMLFTISTTSVKFKSMLTVTYPKEFPVNGLTAKGHLKKVLDWLRHTYKTPVFWFLEFQPGRSAVHFHIYTCVSDPTDKDRRSYREMWCKIIGLSAGRDYCLLSTREQRDMWTDVVKQHRREQVWENLRTPDGAARYTCKYALKCNQKEVPWYYRDVGRFWGCSSSVRDGVEPMASYDIDNVALRDILNREDHSSSGLAWLPRYIFNSSSLRLDEKEDQS